MELDSVTAMLMRSTPQHGYAAVHQPLVDSSTVPVAISVGGNRRSVAAASACSDPMRTMLSQIDDVCTCQVPYSCYHNAAMASQESSCWTGIASCPSESYSECRCSVPASRVSVSDRRARLPLQDYPQSIPLRSPAPLPTPAVPRLPLSRWTGSGFRRRHKSYSFQEGSFVTSI